MGMIRMQKQNGERTIQNAYDEFKRIKKIQNVSPKTLVYYDSCIKSFGTYYSLDIAINDLNKYTYLGYIEYLQNKDLKITDVSINSYLRGMRAFLKFCMGEGYIHTFKVELIREDKVIKETYSNDELRVLLEKPNIKKCDFSEYRTWVMENFFLGTGVRLSTAISIKISEVDFENQLIKLSKTKNRCQQYIPLSASLSHILKEYLEYRGGEKDEYLFCTKYGKKLTVSGTETAIQRYNQRRGITRTSVHLFRHTFAKLWIMNGGDTFTLQRLLGHKSLEMVKRYVHMYGNEVQKQYFLYNPLDNFIENKKSIRLQ